MAAPPTPVLLIISSAVDPPARSGRAHAGQDPAPRRRNDLDRLGLVCWACPLADGRRDEQAPPLAQHEAVGVASMVRGVPAGVPTPGAASGGAGAGPPPARGGRRSHRTAVLGAFPSAGLIR